MSRGSLASRIWQIVISGGSSNSPGPGYVNVQRPRIGRACRLSARSRRVVTREHHPETRSICLLGPVKLLRSVAYLNRFRRVWVIAPPAHVKFETITKIGKLERVGQDK